MSIRQKNLPIAALERIDDACADFERMWQSNHAPSIEAAIPTGLPPVEQEVLLAELIGLDVDYRRRRGESPTARDYLERFPQNIAVVHEALRDGHGSSVGFVPPSVDRLAALFPSLEIIELIGAGGMGAVYKARQTGLDRLVALKVLPEEFGHDVKFALRFTREARTLAKLNHPNIVSVFEFGNVEDTYYFLMEFVDGATLRDIVRAGELEPNHALKVVPYLCDALQYAHDQGVIHRDIKPENILMAVDGGVKIADFGLSRILDNEGQQEALTGTHQVMGTPRYMAPEQLEGAQRVDHRADIYSLGVVFYEMLTGELPIGRFAPPSRKVQIDVRLDDVVLRTLEKEPQRRYQRASQVKSDVESIASAERAGEPTIPYRGQELPLGDDPMRNPPTQDGPTTTMHSTMKHPTMMKEAGLGAPDPASVALSQQELAGRMLLTRRQLLERVESSLYPLWRWQILQLLVGIGFIVLGAQCWARNTGTPHRLANGLIVHVYGVLVIAQSLLVCTRMRRIDYSKPVVEIRKQLDFLRSGYLQAGVIIGFAWWLMWIPIAVACGFDMVVHPNCLNLSLVIGSIGFIVSLGLYGLAIRSKNPSSEVWRRKLAGKSIGSASLALEEMEAAQIE